MNSPPTDWSDKAGWNDYFNANLVPGGILSHPFYNDEMVLRYLSLAREKGRRIWFPGCGFDPYPKAYAERGWKVLATDLSPVAVAYQQRAASALLEAGEITKLQGTLTVAEHDFTRCKPEGEFDLVINHRAFQGLSADGMRAAGGYFYAALQPGGVCILDTINVGASYWRNLIEDSLIGAGFFVPGVKSERWYRQQLESAYGMLMGRPDIPDHHQYLRELAERRKKIQPLLDEHERRLKEEMAEANAIIANPVTKVAYVVYGSG